MLSERERRQLDDIELDLRSSDPALSAVFARLPQRRARRQLAFARRGVALGVLLLVAGLVVGYDPAFMGGLVLVLAGAWRWAWLRAPSPDCSADGLPGGGAAARD